MHRSCIPLNALFTSACRSLCRSARGKRSGKASCVLTSRKDVNSADLDRDSLDAVSWILRLLRIASARRAGVEVSLCIELDSSTKCQVHQSFANETVKSTSMSNGQKHDVVGFRDAKMALTDLT